MRILFVWPIVRFSVWDVATGCRKALARQLGDANIKDYYLDKHFAYHHNALPEGIRDDTAILSRYASESVLAEALYFNADLVIVVSGLNFNPCGTWLLHKVGIPTAVLFTESPYEDEAQAEWASANPDAAIFTNDSYSAARFGWTYLAHAYDPETHFKDRSVDRDIDILFVGSAWPERIALLEAVDWSGLSPQFYGFWPELRENSPLRPFLQSALVKNSGTADLYRRAKICLNFHRHSDVAQSLGPRVFETAACGAFQVSDPRPALGTIFGEAVPTFTSASGLQTLLRHYLSHPFERRRLAQLAHERVHEHTFDSRVPTLLQGIRPLLKETA